MEQSTITILLVLLGSTGHSLGANDRANDIHRKLGFAANEGKFEEVKQLIKDGANVNAKNDFLGRTALIRAAERGYADIARFLIDNGADVNVRQRQNDTALLATLRYQERDYEELATLLINKGADVNVREMHGYTPLMFAALAGNTKLVSLLLAKGADMNIKNDDGDNVSYLVKYEMKYDPIRALLREARRLPKQ